MSEKSKLTYEILAEIFDVIDRTFEIDDVTDNGDGTFTLETTNTLWVTKGYSVAIDGTAYVVSDMMPDEWIKIEGTVEPTVDTFEVYSAHFRHGSLMATRAELNATPAEIDKYPMIFMHDKIVERFNYDDELTLDRESRCKFYALVPCDIEKWVITDHDRYAIRPMRNLMNAFVSAIKASSVVYDEGLVEGEWSDEHKFGVFIQQQGSTKPIFADNLSGTGLDMTIPFIQIGCEEDSEAAPIPSGNCDPVTILDQDNNVIAEVDAGDTYRVIVFDGIVDNGPPYANSIVATP